MICFKLWLAAMYLIIINIHRHILKMKIKKIVGQPRRSQENFLKGMRSGIKLRAWKVPTCPYQTSEGTKTVSYSQNNSKSSFQQNRALSALHVISTLSFSGHEPCQNFYTMHMLPWSRNSTRHYNCKYRPLISITKSCSKFFTK